MSLIIDTTLENYSRLLGPKLGTFLHDDVAANPVTNVRGPQGSFIDWEGGFGSLAPDGDLVIGEDEELPSVIRVSASRVSAYSIRPTALGVRVSFEEQRRLRSQGIDLRRGKTAILTRLKKIWRELDFANLIFSTSTFTGRNSTPSNLWDTDAGDPLADMLFARGEVVKASGERINTLIVGYEVHEALQNSKKLKDYIKYSAGIIAAGPLSEDMIRRALGLEHYCVGWTPYNAGLPGTPAASNSFIFGKFALFCFNQQSPTEMTPQSCIQRWRMDPTGRDAADAIRDGQVRRYPLTGGYLEQIDLCNNDQFTVPTPKLGWLYTGVVS